MNFSSNQIIAVIAFIVVWWLFYFMIKMRADHKYLKSDFTETYKPCTGCLITQSAMMSAALLSILYVLVELDFIGIVKN